MKTNLKVLVVFAIILGAMLLFSFNTVSATEYSDKNQKVIITVEDLGLGGTKSVKNEWNEPDEFEGEVRPGTIYSTLEIKGVKQNLLNTYSNSKKQVNVKTKIQIPNNIIKAEIDGVIANIENINGKKYVEVSETLQYTNTPFEPLKGSGKPVSEDVCSITIGEKDSDDPNTTYIKVKLYETETKSNEYKIYSSIHIVSENEPFAYEDKIVNKYDIPYYPDGGFGGYVFADKSYLQTENDTSFKYLYPFNIPQEANLAETYFKIKIDVYQGEKIELENVGTLYYMGTEKYAWGEYYIYKNSLNNLKNSSSILIAKTKSGYTLKRSVSCTYNLNENLKEQVITGNFNSDSTNTKLNVKFNVSGVGNAKIDAVQIPKTDILYERLEKEMLNKIDKDKYNSIILDVFDIQVVEGAYKGKLNITFNVGTENNGKECIVGHLCLGDNGLGYEFYKQTVENGKITITVDSLSPFMVSLLEEKSNTNLQETPAKPTEKGEKDTTPKTGTIDIIGYVLVTTILSGIGIVALKKRI